MPDLQGNIPCAWNGACRGVGSAEVTSWSTYKSIADRFVSLACRLWSLSYIGSFLSQGKLLRVIPYVHTDGIRKTVLFSLTLIILWFIRSV